MADKINYRAVLKDLKDQHRKLTVAIEAIEGLISADSREKSRAGETSTSVASSRNGHNPSEITMLNGAYEVLKQEGKALHAGIIAQRLNKQYGKSTHQNSVAARLPQDKRKRFKNIGQNTWELTEW